MKKLNARKHATNLYDSANGRTLRTKLAIDIKDELPDCKEESVLLLYTEAERGPIVQIQLPGAFTYYFLQTIEREDTDASNLGTFAMWCGTTRRHLIDLCLEHSPYAKA